MSATGSTSYIRKRKRPRRASRRLRIPSTEAGIFLGLIVVLSAAGWWFWSHYTLGVRSPVLLQLQSPIVISERMRSDAAMEAETDQNGRRLSAWQQYTCRKFGAECRVALAIQRAENPAGKCEIYHYNTNGTLDWGYFQINTVHLTRPGLNLRDLLDCQANIDFAYQLFVENGGFGPWSTFKSGAYRRFMHP